MTPSRELRMADYITQTGLTLQEMRLIIEGALFLYTEEASPLIHLGRTNDQLPAAEALSTISCALYDLRELICGLQKEYMKEVRQQMDELLASEA